MSPVDVLLWVAAAFGAVVFLTVVAFLIVLVWAAIVGLRKMRADEEQDERSIFKSGGGR